MKAAVMTDYGDPDVLVLDEVPTPEPGEGEVLLRILAAGLNRLDNYLREGSVTRDIALPHVLGSDASAVVERVGGSQSAFRPGDRVIPMPGYPLDPADAHVRPVSLAASYAIRGIVEWGTCAEFMVVPERWLVRDDTGLPPEAVATLPMPLVTCVRAVKTVGGVKAGDSVLVHGGASGTGSVSVQVARALGAHVATTVRTPAKAEFARGLGAERVVAMSGEDFVEAVLDWTDGRGVDVVIDNLGGEIFTRSLQALRAGGTLVSMGMVTGLEATIELRSFFFAQKRILGTLMGDPEDLAWGLDAVKAGRIRPTLDTAMPLSEAAHAHARLAAGEARGTIVLVPGG